MSIHDHIAAGNLDGIIDELRARGSLRFQLQLDLLEICRTFPDRLATTEGAAALGDEIMGRARVEFAKLRRSGRPIHAIIAEVVRPYEIGRELKKIALGAAAGTAGVAA